MMTCIPTLKAASEKERQHKGIRFAVKDAEKGLVTAIFATMGVKDYDNDLTLPGAFEDGASVAISAYGHRSWMGVMPVGKGVIRVEKDKAILDGQFFLQTAGGKETFEVVKAMESDQEWSYGFDVLETGELTEDLRQKGVYRVLKKLKVFEVSPVLVGAGIDTQTLSVKDKEKPEEPVSPKPTPEETIEARKQYARFMKTRVRLVE